MLNHKKNKATILIIVLMLLTFCVSPANAAVYTYDDLGRVTSVTYDSGQKVFYTYDAAGNILSEKTTEPNAPPLLTVTSPIDNLQTSNNWVAVTGYVEVGSTVSVNGTSVSTDINGNFTTTVNLVSGNNIITIVATDAVGNTTTITRTVIYNG